MNASNCTGLRILTECILLLLKNRVTRPIFLVVLICIMRILLYTQLSLMLIITVIPYCMKGYARDLRRYLR